VVNSDKNGAGTLRYLRLEPHDADGAAKTKDRTMTKLYNELPGWLHTSALPCRPLPAHLCLAPLLTIQDTGGKGCGTTSNLPRLTRIPRTGNQSRLSCSRQGGSFACRF
jgi:hypothetical protein